MHWTFLLINTRSPKSWRVMKPAVYPSSEDTSLLLDALKEDENVLRGAVHNGGVCIEIGSGSGEVSVALSNLLGSNAVLLSTDVNPMAIQATSSALRDTRSDVICGDLFSFFHARPVFDIIVFNPPYVPTDDDEYQKSLAQRDISASWAGGLNGREITDRCLRTAIPCLRSDGVMYLVVIDLNDVDDVTALARSLGYQCNIACERTAGIEKLYVLRLHKKGTFG